MEKLGTGRPKKLNTDKFILCCGNCRRKICGAYLSKRANCANNCKNESENYIRGGAVYYNKYTKEEYKKSEITDEAMKKINIERYKINVLKQKIMVKRIQRWIRRIINIEKILLIQMWIKKILYKPGGELYKKFKKTLKKILCKIHIIKKYENFF